EHLELRTVDVDLADQTVEVCERARDDTHLLAGFVLEARPHLLLDLYAALFLLAGAEDVLDLLAREGRGLRAAADESGDAGRVADEIPSVVGEPHPPREG